MFYLYDTAITEDLRSIFNDERIFICPPDRYFSVIARLYEDDVKFPMISLFRTGTSLQASQHPMRFKGGLLKIDEANQEGAYLQAIPIRINYLLEVWTKHREENDNIVRELLFYYMTHPTLKVSIPYGTNLKHNFNIFFDTNIEDNSDVSNQVGHGEYFRQTLSVYTDDAYLWKSTINKPAILGDVDLYVYDGGKYVHDN